MKKIVFLLSTYIYAANCNGQSVTITPNPTNGVMIDAKNKPADLPNFDYGSQYGITIPKVEILPSSPQIGMMVFFYGKIHYYTGTTWITLDKPEVLPNGAMVLNETKNNTTLINAGFSMRGLTMMSYNPVNYGDFAWISPLNQTDIPTYRNRHAAVWTGSEMIVWGGSDGNYLSDGRKYNLATDSWQPISNSFLQGRVFHAMVWTGSKMIVWGGNGSQTYFNDGAIYDPTTDIWSTMSTINAPSSRTRFSYIWTGTELIIWGGYVFDGTNNIWLNDGKKYNPITNTWSNINMVNAPSVRSDHVSVWTGSKMIIWGGRTLNSYLNTGAIYDPQTDSWASISTTGTPQGCVFESAVWTGSKMIIFGGVTNVTPNNSCFAYDPSTNLWTTANTTNAPSPRYSHTAVWTGQKMIVFGGNSGTVELSDGGIYDPILNTWSNNKIPLNKQYSTHTAVWTGNDMIIYGKEQGDIGKQDFRKTTTKAMYLYQKQ